MKFQRMLAFMALFVSRTHGESNPNSCTYIQEYGTIQAEFQEDLVEFSAAAGAETTCTVSK